MTDEHKQTGKMIDDLDVGDVIREARERKGISQTDLAELLEVTRATVNGYESGKHPPTVSTLRKVAKALGMQLKITLE